MMSPVAPMNSNSLAQQDQERLRETASHVVGSVFFGTLLETARESRIRGTYGHGGRGEEIFAAQWNGLIAERLGSQIRGGLGEAIYRSLSPQQERMSTQRTGRMELMK